MTARGACDSGAVVGIAAVSATLASITYAAARFGSAHSSHEDHHSITPRPTAVPPSQVETETPEQVLDRWDRSVQSATATAFADTYPEKAYVHGFYSVRDTEARARGAWAERVRRGGWFRRGTRTRTEEIASQISGSARLGCFDSSAPNATVLRFAASAEWLNPLTHPAVPCPRIRCP